jgi:hypothetical protein
MDDCFARYLDARDDLVVRRANSVARDFVAGVVDPWTRLMALAVVFVALLAFADLRAASTS